MEENFVIDTGNIEFQDALSSIQYTSQAVFLTGKAGTGKSTFLKYVCEHTKKKYVVLAPTGVSAINVGGSTIHSFFKLPFAFTLSLLIKAFFSWKAGAKVVAFSLCSKIIGLFF